MILCATFVITISSVFIFFVSTEVCAVNLCFACLCADHQAKGGLAGVQLSSGCRWALYLHSGGTWTESLLQRCQRQTAPPAPGKGMNTPTHTHTEVHAKSFYYQHTWIYTDIDLQLLLISLCCRNPPRLYQPDSQRRFLPLHLLHGWDQPNDMLWRWDCLPSYLNRTGVSSALQPMGAIKKYCSIFEARFH